MRPKKLPLIFPKKLKVGDQIRILSPSQSLVVISQGLRALANERLHRLGLKITFGQHVEENDPFSSATVASRVEDLHNAFLDPNVKGILTAIGGHNSNTILAELDYKLIRSHPKILCGYSDITALQNAILAQSGLVTYSGPHYSTFGMKKGFNYTLDYFKKCLFEDKPFRLDPSPTWSDDAWYANQKKRKFIRNRGIQVLHPGKAEGTIIGGNLCTLNLLQGTPYMPSLKDSVLFIEDDEALGDLSDSELERNLQSLIHLPDFSGVQALVIGRFQKGSEIKTDILHHILESKPQLKHMPVLYDVDFGHTFPIVTFPIGGRVRIHATAKKAIVTVLRS